jgi:uncharacterized protein
MQHILIAGGSGLVGKRLTYLLQQQGHTVSWLTRNANKTIANVTCYEWDINAQTINAKAFENCTTVINLAGEGIADKRWSTLRKKAIIDSRVLSTQLLVNYLNNNTHNVTSFVSASAIGYYGASTLNKALAENTPPANDFLGQCCLLWENEIFKLNKTIRTTVLRIGIVLTANGGALPQMALPVKLYVGSPLASGKQYLPWIHIDDLSNMFIQAATLPNYNGVYNAVAPTNKQCNNADFTKAIAKQLRKPCFLPNVPAFMLKAIVGEMAILIINGNIIDSAKIEAEGFKYHYPTLAMALANLLR